NSCAGAEGGDRFFLHEFVLEGLNPACDSGLHLSEDFLLDVDSIARSGPWDIGADQHRELKLGFVDSAAHEWWEAEGEARVQVLLREPVAMPVSVAYRTTDSSAYAGQDYDSVAGRLTFAPGEVSKIITVPLVDDGPGDDGETFSLELEDLRGAEWLSYWAQTFRITIKDSGTPPIRAVVAQTLVTLTEGSGPAQLAINLSEPAPAAERLNFEAQDGAARIALDFVEPSPGVDLIAGAQSGILSLGAIDDDDVEGHETYLIEPASFFASGVAPDAPSAAVVQIQDNDQPRVVLSTNSVLTMEGDAALIAVTVRLEGDPGGDVTVDLSVVPGSAGEGVDYQVELASNPTTLTLNALEPEVILDVARVLDDGDLEGNEAFSVVLSNALGVGLGVPATTVVTIDDNEGGIEIDIDEVFLELSFCEPELECAPGAVLALDGTALQVWVTGHRYDNSWMEGPLEIPSGGAFSFDLFELDPGDVITLHAESTGGDTADAEIYNDSELGPAINGDHIEVSHQPGGEGPGILTVTVHGEAITNRVSDVELNLVNEETWEYEWLDDPCWNGGSVVGTIAADAGDQVVLQVCQGSGGGGKQYECSEADVWPESGGEGPIIISNGDTEMQETE
ncbi:MAG: hypothetical protein DRJ61_14260, partial [Acidobacteria bacterium]